jgi:hypothetical protein
MRELECVEIVELTTDYLEGALDTDAHREVAEHCVECWACERYIGEVVTVVGLMSSLPAVPVSPALEADLLTLFREWATA